MMILQDQKKIGVIHIITQLIAFIVFTKGMGILLLLALAEFNGWVMLVLWLIFNFGGIVSLVNVTDSLFDNSASVWIASVKILLIALIAGVISYFFELIYYTFYFCHIGKGFVLNNYKDSFWSSMKYVPPVVAIGELIRRNPALFRKVNNN